MTLINKFNPVYNSLADILNEYVADEKQIFKPSVTVPAVNIKETEKDFVLELAVPGINKEDISIDLEKNILTVSGSRKDEQLEEKENYSKREFNYRNFKRSFTLPKTVNFENIQAEYSEGILVLTISKKEQEIQQKRSITIN